MNGLPPRWHDRLQNYVKALALLQEAADEAQVRTMSELEKAGVVQRFEIVWELGWKLMADVLTAEQTPPTRLTATSTVRAAMNSKLINDGDTWLVAGNLRNALSHDYLVSKRDELMEQLEVFLPMFTAFKDTLYADIRG